MATESNMISTREFYTMLEGTYTNHRELDERVRQKYLEVWNRLPPGWPLLRLIQAGDDRGWFVNNPDGTVSIVVPGRHKEDRMAENSENGFINDSSEEGRVVNWTTSQGHQVLMKIHDPDLVDEEALKADIESCLHDFMRRHGKNTDPAL